MERDELLGLFFCLISLWIPRARKLGILWHDSGYMKKQSWEYFVCWIPFWLFGLGVCQSTKWIHHNIHARQTCPVNIGMYNSITFHGCACTPKIVIMFTAASTLWGFDLYIEHPLHINSVTIYLIYEYHNSQCFIYSIWCKDICAWSSTRTQSLYAWHLFLYWN